MYRSGARTSIEMLAMVRHGQYENDRQYNYRDGSLTQEGVDSVSGMGVVLMKCLTELGYLEHGKTLMVVSDKIRAKETARILQPILGLWCMTLPILGLNDDMEPYHERYVLEEMKNLIAVGGGYQGLVVVTHGDQTRFLPKALHPRVQDMRPILHFANAAVYDPQGKVEYISASTRYKPGE